MSADIFWIPEIATGRLATAMCPDGGPELADSIRAWREAGVNVVVSALTPFENQVLELTAEVDACRDAGITFRSFPIEDHWIPDVGSRITPLVEEICSWLHEGRSVVAHCRMGIGRSSLIAACALVRLGFATERAFDLIGAARGFPVPDGIHQEEWVDAFARGDHE
jgi:protein-tyrosine phosphatase